ncbi:hypothetical protein [Dyella nitratireducens]|uniref:Uncharacterized protein n=1 Tax=Dyella nitratireducens TaxID=1849580 RepID=A0ABQ1GC31_9GAMM|nr:hypothetical protein [Dyella nitratireducens]GGA40857.1 hypothetical protein GCM10010981_32600 [Dyella nitratireducens]GLQ40618.1 hypothetical protein GCM10007902_04670 [Dyella nitratireducens]
MWETETAATISHATTANQLIEQLTGQLAQFVFEKSTSRQCVALPLLKASIDAAAAATRLLMVDPIQYGSAAEALFRPQLERYMRAIYFGSPHLTTDEQVRAFLEDDKISITFDHLAERVGEEIVRQIGKPDDMLGKLFGAALVLEKRDLHGAVHGGQLVVRRYLNDALAFNPWVLSTGAIIMMMLALAMLAFSQYALLCGAKQMNTSVDFAKMLVAAFPAMKLAIDPSTPLPD